MLAKALLALAVMSRSELYLISSKFYSGPSDFAVSKCTISKYVVKSFGKILIWPLSYIF
jgi:hypothetical protein